MVSMEATFPALSNLALTSDCHVVRGGFDFMIPSSASASAGVLWGGLAGSVGPRRFVGTPGLAVPGSDFQMALDSWALDSWTRFDFLFTPRRVDMWIDGDLVTSRTVFRESFTGQIQQSPGCEVDNLWVAGGNLA